MFTIKSSYVQLDGFSYYTNRIAVNDFKSLMKKYWGFDEEGTGYLNPYTSIWYTVKNDSIRVEWRAHNSSIGSYIDWEIWDGTVDANIFLDMLKRAYPKDRKRAVEIFDTYIK